MERTISFTTKSITQGKYLLKAIIHIFFKIPSSLKTCPYLLAFLPEDSHITVTGQTECNYYDGRKKTR